jgi:hypothetical protein
VVALPASSDYKQSLVIRILQISRIHVRITAHLFIWCYSL